ncbi:hypothetical protein JHK82_027569 [Glycine max]|nr:hypothetical protein JHK82_027569 [Glycine max]
MAWQYSPLVDVSGPHILVARVSTKGSCVEATANAITEEPFAVDVNPDDIVFGGWDINNMNLADAMARAKVFDINLQKQLRPYMESMLPFPKIYDPNFIATN